MNAKSRIESRFLAAAILLSILMLTVGCQPRGAPEPTIVIPTPRLPPTPTNTQLPPTKPPPAHQPTHGAPQTYWKDFIIGDFTAVHSPVDSGANEHLIFGNIAVPPPSAGLAPELAGLLGRWEGYNYSPPVSKDYKAVVVIQEIDDNGGTAYLWYGSILQYPELVKKIRFRVVRGAQLALESDVDLGPGPDGLNRKGIVRIAYDREQETLRGGILSSDNPQGFLPVEFGRGQALTIFRDYEKYFAGKRIYARPYRDPDLQTHGWGYLIYLPEGYEQEPDQDWPLIYFLCGSGERGTNPLVLAKHGPWNYILQKGPLPFVIFAPMLNETRGYRSFPEEYMDGALDEALAEYRIDPKRVYLTGLSMGGEATYRFALYRPEAFAAVAPFAAFNAKYMTGAVAEGFKPLTLPLERARGLPFWAFHGTDDPLVPLEAAQATVNAFIQAGVDVRFTILDGADHDSWSQAFMDPAFYRWLLEQRKP